LGTKIKISVDQGNYNTNILVEGDLQILIDLRLMFSGISNSFFFSENSITVPWFDFKRGLVNFVIKTRQYGAVVEMDSTSRSLTDAYLDDKNCLKKGKLNIQLESDELESLLKQEGFIRVLKKEQVRDAQKLLRLNHGANFSVPGAGKTTTILAVYSILRKIKNLNKLFVIAPINAFISWEDEVEEIFGRKELKIIRLEKADITNFSRLEDTEADILLVNYEKLRNNINGLIPFFCKNNVHLILDESHRIKAGFRNLSFSQIALLADISKRRDILSGTPLPQGISDLIPQFEIIWPGEVLIPESLSEKKDENSSKEVNNIIKDLFVRTTKNELGLKDPKITYTYIEMGPLQGELYKLIKSEAARKLARLPREELLRFRQIGKSVVKLLQTSTNPMLLSSNDEYTEEIFEPVENTQIWDILEAYSKYEKPSKIEYLKKRVREILNAAVENKIVIWTYFIRNIILLEKLLKDYNPVIIYGGVSSGLDNDFSSREGRIRKFHNDASCRLMIANPQACGEGISLHKVCHYAIYLDRNFNSAHYLQSVDRIHRLGLDKSIETNIEILLSTNTIDEGLMERLNEKIKAMGEILDDKYLLKLVYDPADIEPIDEIGIDQKDIEVITKHIISDGNTKN
jgi:SNF2 family DNA or RNA helicase